MNIDGSCINFFVIFTIPTDWQNLISKFYQKINFTKNMLEALTGTVRLVFVSSNIVLKCWSKCKQHCWIPSAFCRAKVYFSAFT